MNVEILLVDDHQIVRDGLRLLIQRENDLTVVGEAGDGPTALAQARVSMPHLIVMDVHLGDSDGLETSRQILAHCPHAKVLILSAEADPARVSEAIAAGVRGYLLKTHAAQELIRAIRAILAGNTYLCPEISSALVANYKQLLVAAPAPAKPRITDRECEVLKLTAEGLRIKDIASRLNIGVKTVETHRAHLMKKLGCSSTAELTRHAIREGISPI